MANQFLYKKIVRYVLKKNLIIKTSYDRAVIELIKPINH